MLSSVQKCAWSYGADRLQPQATPLLSLSVQRRHAELRRRGGLFTSRAQQVKHHIHV